MRTYLFISSQSVSVKAPRKTTRGIIYKNRENSIVKPYTPVTINFFFGVANVHILLTPVISVANVRRPKNQLERHYSC